MTYQFYARPNGAILVELKSKKEQFIPRRIFSLMKIHFDLFILYLAEIGYQPLEIKNILEQWAKQGGHKLLEE